MKKSDKLNVSGLERNLIIVEIHQEKLTLNLFPVVLSMKFLLAFQVQVQVSKCKSCFTYYLIVWHWPEISKISIFEFRGLFLFMLL